MLGFEDSSGQIFKEKIAIGFVVAQITIDFDLLINQNKIYNSNSNCNSN